MSEYLKVLWELKKQARTYQSDFVRSRIALVNEAASRGHISCVSVAGKNMGVGHSRLLVNFSFLNMEVLCD